MKSRNGIQGTYLMGMVILACGVGCSAESAAPKSGGSSEETSVANETGEDTSKALLTIEIEPGHTVSFYEPEPGVVFPFERLKQGQHSELNRYRGTDPIDLFQALRPGEAVPVALVEAQARAAMADVKNPPDADLRPGFGGGSPAKSFNANANANANAITNTDPDTGVVRQAYSSTDPAHFVNDHGGCTAGTVFGHCRINWYHGYWSSATTKFQGCTVDHFAGNGVTVRFQAGSAITDNYLAPGTVGIYWNYLPKVSMIRRIDVINAENDGFHVGCYWGDSY